MEEPTEAEEAGGAGFNPEILKSYASFAGRAIKARKVLMGVVFAVGIVLTYLVVTYLPRTYRCTTVLMTVSNEVLDSDRGNPLTGAVGLIMRHENLEAVILAARRIMSAAVRLQWFTAGYGWVTVVAPIVIASPVYFAGDLTFGGLMMAAAAFTQVHSSLRWFVDNIGAIADWRATLMRVASFRLALIRIGEG